MKVQMPLQILFEFLLSTTTTTMALLGYILGVVVGFAGIRTASVLQNFIIYKWPASKIGKILAWSPPLLTELGYPEFDLLRRLVEAEEGRLELERARVPVSNTGGNELS